MTRTKICSHFFALSPISCSYFRHCCCCCCHWFPIYIYYYQSTLLIQYTMSFAFDCKENMLCCMCATVFCSLFSIWFCVHAKKEMKFFAELCRKTRRKCTHNQREKKIRNEYFWVRFVRTAMIWNFFFSHHSYLLSLWVYVSASLSFGFVLSKYQIISIFGYISIQYLRGSLGGKKYCQNIAELIFVFMMCRKWIASYTHSRSQWMQAKFRKEQKNMIFGSIYNGIKGQRRTESGWWKSEWNRSKNVNTYFFIATFVDTYTFKLTVRVAATTKLVSEREAEAAVSVMG